MVATGARAAAANVTAMIEAVAVDMTGATIEVMTAAVVADAVAPVGPAIGHVHLVITIILRTDKNVTDAKPRSLTLLAAIVAIAAVVIVAVIVVVAARATDTQLVLARAKTFTTLGDTPTSRLSEQRTSKLTRPIGSEGLKCERIKAKELHFSVRRWVVTFLRCCE